MPGDFLTAVWRSATRQRSYAAINLIGLALGFACCLILVCSFTGNSPSTGISTSTRASTAWHGTSLPGDRPIRASRSRAQ